jgi:hypothetical protein
MEVQMQFHEQFLMIEAMKEIHAQPTTNTLERVNWRGKLARKLIELATRLEPNVFTHNISHIKSSLKLAVSLIPTPAPSWPYTSTSRAWAANGLGSLRIHDQ